MCLVKTNGKYTSLKEEMSTRMCRKNLQDRITELSNADNFEEAKDEWFRTGENNLTFIPDYSTEDCLCICGNRIMHVFIITNYENGKKAIIGSRCIKHFDIKELVEEASKKYKFKCETCNCYVKDLTTHYKSTKHDKMVNSRKCLDCDKRIKNTEPTWKTRCIKCYKNKK